MMQAARVAWSRSRPRWTSSAIPTATTRDAAWARAIADVGGDGPRRSRVLARACADGPLVAARRRSTLARWSTRSRPRSTGPDWAGAVSALADELRAARALPDAFAPATIRWPARSRRGRPPRRARPTAGLAALRLIQQVRPGRGDGADGAGPGAAARPRAGDAPRVRRSPMRGWPPVPMRHVVFGPRFAVYTPVVQLARRLARRSTSALAVREDANVIDRLCRLALGYYEAWRAIAGRAVRVLVDGADVPCPRRRLAQIGRRP